MIKNYEDFVNENNLQKTNESVNLDTELEEEYSEEVYESLLSWVATTMNEYREMFNDDDRLCEFINFQLKAAHEDIEEKCDVDSFIRYYCK
jgi:hypothetical protein